MPWSTTRPAGTQAKYRSKEHRDLLASYKLSIARDGYVVCAAVDCLFETRLITNPCGMEPDGVTVGHEDDGVRIRGPEHRADNVRDGARRGNARSHGAVRRWEF